MAANGPSITDVKLLFARSGNRCAFPKCCAPMALNETLIGEICHIKGARSGSARYDPAQPDPERHAYANLILMCPTHHTVIDDDEEAFTVEHLRKLKAAHEANATPIPEREIAAIGEFFVQSVSNIGQSGGLSAHTVNASSITVQSAPSINTLSQRQIQAVEHLWQIARNLGREFSFVIFIDDILTAQELDAYFRVGAHASIADCVRECADVNFTLHKFVSAGSNGADIERPFVSARLWSVFFILKAIYGRTALLISNSYKEKRLINWRLDHGCDQLLRAVLPGHAVDHVKKQEIGGLRAAVDHLESQFLTEARLNGPHVQ